LNTKLKDLETEHGIFVDIINQRLKEIDSLDSKLDNLEKGLIESAGEQFDLNFKIDELARNSVKEVLQKVEDQSFIDVSPRWRIGESATGSGDFILLDRLSSIPGKPSFYRFSPEVKVDL